VPGLGSSMTPVRTRVRKQARTLRSDVDWGPIAIVIGADGETTQVPLRGPDWTSALVPAVGHLDPRMLCVVSTAPTPALNADERRRAQIDPEHVPTPSERVREGRSVMLHAVDRTGLTIQAAPITQSPPQPPEAWSLCHT